MQFLKKFIPTAIIKFGRPYYHGMLAILASWYFGQPSRRLVVIGITGTAGKSTTVQMLARILNRGTSTTPPAFGGHPSLAGGENVRCGFITTVSFFDGKTEYVNKHGLSMPGGWLLQKQLAQMVARGCQYAVVECTSEGLEQNRHLGISFDAAVFTNLSDAHLETHGGFAAYRAAKGKLFQSLQHQVSPTLRSGQASSRYQAKAIIVNLDDENAKYFLDFKAERKVGTTFRDQSNADCQKVFSAQQSEGGFSLENVQFSVPLTGKFNHYNALLATATANILGVGLQECASAIATFTKIRGRMEPVENTLGIKIFVDYGCEPATIMAALKAAAEIPHGRLIHVFGSTGGHRDVSKRFAFGRSSAQMADVMFITNDDVYESNPEEIAQHIQEGAGSVEIGERKTKTIYTILDRQTAIAAALQEAKAGDIVLITGKGSEQFLVLPGNNRIEWDDADVVRKELAKLTPNN